jgi:phosphate transport system substrate-binding protein
MKIKNKTTIAPSWILSLAFLSLVFLSSCNNSEPEKELSTPTSGNVKIGFDETLKPLAKEELDAFQAAYPNAHIIASFKPEVELANDFLNDSDEVIMLSRKLNDKENKIFEAKQLAVITSKIAFDALAIIINKANPDSVLTYKQLQDMFSGAAKSWTDIDSKNNLPLNIVFDNQNSSTLRYMVDKFNKTGKAPTTWSALKSCPQVIDYVAANKGALGIIGVNWVSNHHENAANSFIKNVNVAALYPPDTAKGAGQAYQPYQAYIALRHYPLYRDIYMISREGRSGLGAGFMSYISTDRGQTIINLAGLVAANAPIRIMEVKNKLDESQIK